MTLNFLDSAVKDLRKLEDKLTREIRLSAIRAGWSRDIVKGLKVNFKNGDFIVTYPDSQADAVDDLEYGTRISNPKSVFRTFSSKKTDSVVQSIEELAMKTLLDREV